MKKKGIEGQVIDALIGDEGKMETKKKKKYEVESKQSNPGPFDHLRLTWII